MAIYSRKGSSKRKLVKERERELITKEVLLIKKKCNVKCSFAQQAMIWPGMVNHAKQLSLS